MCFKKAISQSGIFSSVMGAYASNPFGVGNAVNALPAPAPAPAPAACSSGGRRSGGPRTPSPAPYHPHQPHQPLAPAKWHIPQQSAHNGECSHAAHRQHTPRMYH